MSSSSSLLTHPLAFIGGGNMARSLIGGLLTRGADPSRIRVAEPADTLRAALGEQRWHELRSTLLDVLAALDLSDAVRRRRVPPPSPLA